MPDEVVHKIYKVASSSDVVQDDEDSNEVDISSLNISDYGDLQTFVPVFEGSDSFSINNLYQFIDFVFQSFCSKRVEIYLFFNV